VCVVKGMRRAAVVTACLVACGGKVHEDPQPSDARDARGAVDDDPDEGVAGQSSAVPAGAAGGQVSQGGSTPVQEKAAPAVSKSLAPWPSLRG